MLFSYNRIKSFLDFDRLKCPIKDKSNYMIFSRDIPRGIRPRKIEEKEKKRKKLAEVHPVKLSKRNNRH
jgi:hypothetical protein